MKGEENFRRENFHRERIYKTDLFKKNDQMTHVCKNRIRTSSFKKAIQYIRACNWIQANNGRRIEENVLP